MHKPEDGMTRACFQAGVLLCVWGGSGICWVEQYLWYFSAAKDPHPTYWDAELSWMLHICYMQPSRLWWLQCCFSESLVIFVLFPFTLRALAAYLGCDFLWTCIIDTQRLPLSFSVSFVIRLDFSLSQMSLFNLRQYRIRDRTRLKSTLWQDPGLGLFWPHS